MNRRSESVSCSCGSGQPYPLCCGVLHAGNPAPSAEALMRSRYTAYVLGLSDYLIQTWHPSTRPGNLDGGDEPTAWLGLKVARCELPGPDRASVEFIARYKVRGRAHRLHEVSRFVREDGRWFYLDGVFPEA